MIPPFVKWLALSFTAAIVVLGFLALPLSTTSVQTGYIGTGMVQTLNANTIDAQLASMAVPPEPYPIDGTQEGPLARDVYENVQVLGHLPAAQFSRLMAAITEWVSPEQGCAYCHGDGGNFAHDDLYTKVVSRRMFQMTMDINANWGDHVAPAGVTCYTCHVGENVPANIWFANERVEVAEAPMIGDLAGQNYPEPAVAYATLPSDPFTPFLVEDHEIRVLGDTSLPTGNNRSIKQTEWTYALMMHMSDSLGVNCTYCHNSRSVAEWDQSPPARATAWYGIRMVRELNNEYLIPLQSEYPDYRLGPLGDAPKTSCATCHNGVYKPLFGANMLADYPGLMAPGPDADSDTGDDETAALEQ
ncbi:MAG: photosynthetic reaction center cytochrome c subunit [Alphaproteobacteria bacterium]|jgi:photosynthetic reaction center cytochrome c subunit|nr:photosynthetic reaction center cytochrome c subunit [Alphaproteobacteria bacterium]